MEINLHKDTVSYYSKVFSVSFSKEETAENIVPDTLPDIGTVLDADAAAILRSKDINDGRISAGGMIFGYIIYRSESDNELRRMPVQLPFSAVWDNAGITQSSKAVLKLELSSFEGRIINSRKLLLRAEIVITADVYSKETCEYTSGADCDSLEYLNEALHFSHVSAVGERTFSISEELKLPAGKPDIGSIIKYRTRLCCEEVEPVGSRLVLKGNALVCLLYRASESEALCSVEMQIPFSQIYDADCESEIKAASAAVMQTGCFVEANSYDGTPADSIRVEIGAVAQFCAWSEGEINCLCDAYSTQHELQISLSDTKLRESAPAGSREENIVYTLNIPGTAKNIIDCYTYLGRQRAENGDHTWPISVKLIYENEAGEPASASADFDIHCSAGPESAECIAEVLSVNARPSAAGAEINLRVRYSMKAEEEIAFATPSEISIDEGKTKNTAALPSVIIMRADGLTSLWSIAKEYNTTVKHINEVNPGINGVVPSRGELLLIAKKR